MCGRFNLIATPSELSELFSFAITEALPPRYNIAPTQPVVAVRHEHGAPGPALGLLLWGLIPFWARDPSIGSRMINARSETAAEKPSFRAPMKYRRCLIPATGFYEWKKTPDGKQPIHITRRDGKPFALAGVWEHWQNRDGSELESCTILTTAAGSLMKPIHDRMPVILQPADFGLWLDPTVQKADAVAHLLAHWPENEMHAEAISTRVNKPQNDDPSILEPVAREAQLSLTGKGENK
jgi:putative SOS response-associated peptidase YedK